MEDFTSNMETLRVAEIRHRMSNGFQLLQSFTRQQLSKSENREARERLAQVLRQIETVAAQQSALSEADSGNLAGFAQEMEPLWRRIGEQAGIEVHVRFDADAPFSPLASETAARILLEAVSNCIEHAFPEGEGGRVEIDVTVIDGHHCRVRVTDDGHGMKNAGRGQGTRIIASLAAELGGVAAWSDRDGGGTVMKIDFPVNLPETVETMTQATI
ncbi:histidine kinase-like protein [Pseudooceanicola batsensis HTCC2597]|uniref:histidine kinase n=1 Tax=Pseudooceanicola batsensis (strain ATCC BAA-863 / DSM 15984 / KCTC 12145 / HTCC2597) TaxID=252305 RepID=A3U302_PSEBH|nr:sensor histidine kinase [Pseudooceanicola batsensis]EAQ01532.1 histidine kinase-like protein [Pseudooceanicola batsensis HTCC2597]